MFEKAALQHFRARTQGQVVSLPSHLLDDTDDGGAVYVDDVVVSALDLVGCPVPAPAKLSATHRGNGFYRVLSDRIATRYSHLRNEDSQYVFRLEPWSLTADGCFTPATAIVNVNVWLVIRRLLRGGQIIGGLGQGTWESIATV